jgi:putative DNA primase/helicase
MGIDRKALIEWLRPHCSSDAVALMYPKRDASGPGWVYGEQDVNRALNSYVDGTLKQQSFDCTAKSGTSYTIEEAQRLGVVLHRDGLVRVFCLDLDDHNDDGGNVNEFTALSRFFGAKPVVFTSKSGKGLHAFFELADPIPCDEWVSWLKAWGFNRAGEPEVFPKTKKLSQVFLPNEPNENGGDTYQSGTFASCVVHELPTNPTMHLTTRALRFLRSQVTEPGRNTELNNTAFALGQSGLDRDESWRLCLRAAKLCGLDDSEISPTFESGYTSGHTSADQGNGLNEPGIYPLDGIGNAERFVSHHGKDTNYCFEIEQWYIWSGGRWSLKEKASLEHMVKQSARSIEEEKTRALNDRSANVHEVEREYKKHIKYSCGSRGLDEVLKISRSEPGMHVRLEQIDADPHMFNCQNGTIDLRTGKLKQHSRNDLISMISPASLLPGARCERWQQFMMQVFDGDSEMISFVQRAMGYTLCGLTSEQCLFFMHGPGANGKSVLASVMLHVLGDYGQRAPAELVSKPDKIAAGRATPDIYRLRGARGVVTSELQERQKFNEAQLKDMTGGDRLVARGIYKEPVEFDPTHKLWLNGNHKPEISGLDHGIWRRLVIIPMEVIINDRDRDPELLCKLKSEANGILGWMVQGFLDWQENGLCKPDRVLNATSQLRQESDVVGRFLNECCELAAGLTVSKAKLYNHFEQWCKDNGETAIRKNNFGTRIMSRGIVEKRGSQVRSWVNIGIMGDHSDE